MYYSISKSFLMYSPMFPDFMTILQKFVKARKNTDQPEKEHKIRKERAWTWNPGNYNIYGTKETEKKHSGGEI